MPSIFTYLAPFALLLPLGAPPADVPVEPQAPGSTFRELLDASAPLPPQISYQVRIERRVTVRIAPRSAAERQNLMAEFAEVQRPTRYEERKIGKCVSIDEIAGVQTGSGDRLVLFMRDRRMVSARLEKSCRSKDFYSGFYLERNRDGKLCIDRDKLQSRAGANCELNRLRELVPVYE